MAANSSLSLVDLDFDTIKTNLKTYLKAQDLFKDYDFEGSNINVLLDIMSYNTFHNAFYLNMVASESFLDSAQLRNSVLSHAKELNYTPRSSRSASAVVDIEFEANTSVVTIPKGTSFTSSIGFELFTFITNEDKVITSTNNTFEVSNLKIFEGQYVIDAFIIDYENPTQRFVLEDSTIDTQSIYVTVTEDDTAIVRNYTLATSLLGLGALDNVFFLQGAEQGKYEIIFGDGIIGRKPKDNSVIEISHRVTRGKEANGGTLFALDASFTSFLSTPIINTVQVSTGGADPESIESIKYYAPRFYQLQERAINTADYELLLKQKFPEINAISAYGGEDLNPPEFGKVYIAIDISGIDSLPNSKKTEYYNYLKPRTPLSIDPSIIEPSYMHYTVDTTVKYNINLTAFTEEDIKSRVLNKILEYDVTYLNDFKAKFRYSKFVKYIDDACAASVISNDTNVAIYKKIYPLFGVPQNLDIMFETQLTKEVAKLGTQYDYDDKVTLYSDDFVLNGERVKINDDGIGNLKLVKRIKDKVVVINSSLGSVDYETGAVKLLNFNIDALTEPELHFYVIPRTKDFETKKNILLQLDPSHIKINVIGVRDLIGSTRSTCQG